MPGRRPARRHRELRRDRDLPDLRLRAWRYGGAGGRRRLRRRPLPAGLRCRPPRGSDHPHHGGEPAHADAPRVRRGVEEHVHPAEHARPAGARRRAERSGIGRARRDRAGGARGRAACGGPRRVRRGILRLDAVPTRRVVRRPRRPSRGRLADRGARKDPVVARAAGQPDRQ